jgi:hypothetical protein
VIGRLHWGTGKKAAVAGEQACHLLLLLLLRVGAVVCALLLPV